MRFTSDGVSLDVPAGERLLDALDELQIAPVQIACRGANCGSCRVRVERGWDQLVPPTSAEQRTLTVLGCTPGERLACQLVCQGEGELELRWTGR